MVRGGAQMGLTQLSPWVVLADANTARRQSPLFPSPKRTTFESVIASSSSSPSPAV
jgi:hypothetical protein